MSKFSYHKLYNLESAKQANKQVLDSAGAILGRGFEFIDPAIVNQEYKDQTFFNTGVNVAVRGGYASTIISRKRGHGAEFVKSGTNATGQAGTSSISLEARELKTSEFEHTIRYTKGDIERHKLGGMSLQSAVVEAMDFGYKQLIDDIFYEGSDSNTQNIFNFTAVAVGAITVASTAQDIYDLLANNIEQANINVQFKQSLKPDTCEMPIELWSLANRKRFITGGIEIETVLKRLQAENPSMKFIMSHRMGTIGGTGKVAIYNSQPRNMEFVVSVPLELGNLVTNGWKYEQIAHAVIGGLDIKEDTGLVLTGV
ncbi:major capsid family protein [Francisella marina]|uniref:DUF2184 domain-containing protein n=1 Tax=Francisella marina TaxID=2249302 RepID=A0ABX5ZH16_9GAMM|nr:major capsid family protein [Francisella marina]QEO57568.1 DUF2184 domain-containing protein [Francisella marina]